VEFAETTYTGAEILVSPTWGCNLRCKYCFIEKNHVIKEERAMSSDMALRVMDALDEGFPDVKKICIHFYGGEPFCNFPAIKTMVDYSFEKPGRFSFAVTTNGTQLSDGIIETLDKGKFEIVLSIDGPPEIHDSCRRTANDAPSHADVMRFLQAVRSRTSYKVCGSAVIRSGWRLRTAAEYLRSLPVHTIKAQAVRIPTGAPFALTTEERKTYLDDLDVLGDVVIQELEEGKIPRDPRFSSKVLAILKGDWRSGFCGAGLLSFGITPGGNVFPCLLIDEPGTYLGHIDGDPKIWRDAGKLWRQRPQREECKTCPSLKICGGGCPAIISVCGTDECEIITKNCEVAQRIFEHFKDNRETLLAFAGIL